mgnify:CR=1 FL=1
MKPHPDAILVRLNTGEVMPYPVSDRRTPDAKEREENEEVSDAKRHGFSVCVPLIKTASGRRVHISIENQAGGLEGLAKVMRAQRRMGQGEGARQVLACVTVGEWTRMQESDKKALAVTQRPPSYALSDTRDAEIANLKAELARQYAVAAAAQQAALAAAPAAKR